ncbi:BadF/BadG/BcrA/BcrD ATPase family protein [Thermoanaerobacterium thermosaccharolyticum]|uniref:BadF/BadG/BcrA/BcrD ATPase family protein n=1 Tax=Thermoanaerobacterium thermosaccharolyticum TaxID=1517 RepID=UPI0020A3E753|nr:BadF/BadG/BcrA/BcrD ATPase family protein [Thermoanaerobacterium thermosaccharolyticum]MCP2241018.1 N-acetylglucosamine kinase-like BadF-type ATPase [Thermoanaerobacterium thermosaccharolyticum]
MKYVIGIDGGGTKSIITIEDMSGNVLACETGGATNIKSESKDSVSTALKSLIKMSISNANLAIDDCKAICLGTAGAGRAKDREILRNILLSTGIKGNIIITNDAEICLAAGTGKLEGIAVIAGTGSIAYGIDKCGRRFRAGGWGHILGDEGSGYYIGLEAIKAALRSYDGRDLYTELLPLLMEKVGIEKPEDFIKFVYRDNFKKSEIASLAKVVYYAYKKGDKKAKEILENAADELFKLANAVIRRLDLENESTTLVTNGSVLLKNIYIYSKFSDMVKEVYPNINIIKLKGDASKGAAAIALNSLKRK